MKIKVLLTFKFFIYLFIFINYILKIIIDLINYLITLIYLSISKIIEHAGYHSFHFLSLLIRNLKSYNLMSIYNWENGLTLEHSPVQGLSPIKVVSQAQIIYLLFIFRSSLINWFFVFLFLGRRPGMCPTFGALPGRDETKLNPTIK